MNAEIKRGAGQNRVVLTLDIDGLGRSIVFKTGANVKSPISVTATAHGGTTTESLYDPWLVEGSVTVNKNLAQWLIDVYLNHNSCLQTSATLMVYSSTESLMLKHTFANVRVHRLPHISVEELGAEVSMQIAFSLNDWQGSEVL